MESIAVVHSVKLDPDGRPRPNYLNRLNAALILADDLEINKIIISGGQTREDFPSEAEIGRNYLHSQTNLPIVIEAESRTTIESVLKLKNHIDINHVRTLFVITSDYSLKRFKYLYQALYPESLSKLQFISTTDESGTKYKYAEKFYLAYSKLFPKGGFIMKVTNAIFRNG